MRFPSTAELAPPVLCDLFRRCFEGYVVPVQFDLVQFVERTRMDGVDLVESRVCELDGSPVGVMLVARRGGATRLAAMGLLPSARGKGLGKQAMHQLLREARTRADREMVLEVIEQNPAGVALYRAVGFEVRQRLVGFETGPHEPSEIPNLEEVDVREFNETLARSGARDLPWQASWESFAYLGAPYRAFRRGPAWALSTDVDEASVVLKCVVVEASARRQGHAREFVDALPRRFGGTWRAPAIVPETFGAGVFANWTPQPISQFEMRIDLRST